MKKLKLMLLVLACSFLLSSCGSSKGCGCLSVESMIENVAQLLLG